MAGNSKRQGAVRRSGTKKGATVGSGGQRRKGLQGKGPTPRAEDRPNHKKHKNVKAAQRRASGRPAPRRKGTSTEVAVSYTLLTLPTKRIV